MSNIPYQNKPITITTKESSLITQHKLLTLLGLTLLLTSMILTTLLFTSQQALAKDSPYIEEMYRLYNPNTGEHFYTSSYYERTQCVKAGWNAEGTGWYAPVHSNEPVYRVYNPNSGDHHYTLSKNEKDSLVKLGWKYEGIGWYSSENHDEALYRSYNPNAETGNHNYTRNKNEAAYLNGIGWNDEGIGWYGVHYRSEEVIKRELAQNELNSIKTKYSYNVYLVGYSKSYDNGTNFYYYVDTNNPAPFSEAVGMETCNIYGRSNDGKVPKFASPNRVVMSDMVSGPIWSMLGGKMPNSPDWFDNYGIYNNADYYDYELPDYAPNDLKNVTNGHIICYNASDSHDDFNENQNRVFAECVGYSVANVSALNAPSIPIIYTNAHTEYRYNICKLSKQLLTDHIDKGEDSYFVTNPKQWKVQ